MNISINITYIFIYVIIVFLLILYFRSKNKDILRKMTETKKAHKDILANIMHEIKTPMSIIMGNLEILRRWTIKNNYKRQEQSISSMERNGQHLLSILDSLSNRYAHINNCKESSRTTTPIRNTFNSAIKIACSNNLSREDLVNLIIDKSVPEYIYIDSTAVTQIIVNLVNNAMKFSSESINKNINILVNYTKKNSINFLNFSIKDFGIGINKDELENIFNPFFQCDYTMSRPYKGLGLGLTISKNLVNQMGGKIKVLSSYEHGSIFSISIPVEDKNKELFSIDYPSTPTPLKRNFKLTAQPLNILIVDDATEILHLYKHYLRGTGHNVILTENGQQALDKITQYQNKLSPIDIIFMDLQMPILNGYQTTRILRQKSIYTPVLAITAHETMGFEQLKENYGFNEVIVKPLKKIELIRKINSYYPNNTQAKLAIPSEDFIPQ